MIDERSDSDKIEAIKDALLSVQRGELSEFACLQAIAFNVFNQDEILSMARDARDRGTISLVG